MALLGIDIGGSGIKGAMVDVQTGALVAPRERLETPEEAMPEDVAAVVERIRAHFQYVGPIGAGFPAIILGGVAYSAANVHPSWVGTDVAALINRVTGCPAFVLNDADAAGIAEMRFGAGRQQPRGVVMMITVGTGIGTALFTDGHLLPNTELGHIKIRGKDAEWRASDAARKRKKLTWEQWSVRFQEYLDTMEALFNPDLVIIGGGAVKNWDRFAPYIKLRAKIVPAEMKNEAGIVGAAQYAEEMNRV